jgi:hypothetical protein
MAADTSQSNISNASRASLRIVHTFSVLRA